MQPSHHKPIDSAGVGTGQSRRRGRVRCQSLFIAGERRRCEPGSNSVIVTAPFTGCEGHVLRLGGVRRTRKIFVGCPAIRPIRDQSPGSRNPRLETVGNRLYPLHGQISLCRSAAEAQIQDRSRDKTGPNTAPAFSRVSRRLSRAGGNPEKTKHAIIPSPSMGEGYGEGERGQKRSDRGGCPTHTPVIPTTPIPSPARRERARVRVKPQRKQSTPPRAPYAQPRGRLPKQQNPIPNIPAIPQIPIQTDATLT